MPDTDLIQQFLLTEHNIRGSYVNLTGSYQKIMQQHAYTSPVKDYLGELLAATTLMASSIKFDGTLTVQLESEGPISTLVAKCTHGLEIRGVAKWSDDANLQQLNSALINGKLVVSVHKEKTTQLYQSIVELKNYNIAQALENYFAQSEQLSTRFWLQITDQQAQGVLLQMMPDSSSTDWQIITDEMHTTLKNHWTAHTALEIKELLPNYEMEIYPTKTVRFACHCNKAKMTNAIRMLGEQEAIQMLDGKQVITVNCDFCNQYFDFDRQAVNEIFTNH